MPDDPAAVPEGEFHVTYTAPGGQSVFNTLTVSDHRPYQLVIDPIAAGTAGQPATVRLRLVDRYGRVVPDTTEDGPTLTITDPDGSPVEAVPKTSTGSLGRERWILTNGIATFTLTPPKPGTYHLAAQLHLAQEKRDFGATAEMVVQ